MNVHNFTPSATFNVATNCQSYFTAGRNVQIKEDGKIAWEPHIITALRIASWATIVIPIIVAVLGKIFSALAKDAIAERTAFWEGSIFRAPNTSRYSQFYDNLMRNLAHCDLPRCSFERIYAVICDRSKSDIAFGFDGRFEDDEPKIDDPNKVLLLYVGAESPADSENAIHLRNRLSNPKYLEQLNNDHKQITERYKQRFAIPPKDFADGSVSNALKIVLGTGDVYKGYL